MRSEHYPDHSTAQHTIARPFVVLHCSLATGRSLPRCLSASTLVPPLNVRAGCVLLQIIFIRTSADYTST